MPCEEHKEDRCAFNEWEVCVVVRCSRCASLGSSPRRRRPSNFEAKRKMSAELRPSEDIIPYPYIPGLVVNKTHQRYPNEPR